MPLINQGGMVRPRREDNAASFGIRRLAIKQFADVPNGLAAP